MSNSISNSMSNWNTKSMPNWVTKSIWVLYSIANSILIIKSIIVNLGMGKTGRGAGVGVGDQWVKPGDGNWEIT